jgi:SlyX protein
MGLGPGRPRCYAVAMDERVVALEVRYTHLERQVDELSQVVFEQQKLIDGLTKEILLLRKSLDGVKAGSGDDRPPHY